MKKEHPIFSGEYSRDMWEAINSAKTKYDLQVAMYFVCCRLQELESRLTKRAADSPKAGGKSAKRKVVKAKVSRPAKSG
jgi:guanylate kinase